MNLNKVFLIGNITRDPELKALPSGIKVVSFSLATNRVWKDKEKGKQEEVTFHNIVGFGSVAENVGQYMRKGSAILVEGRIQVRSWEKDGAKHYRTEVIMEQCQFGPKPGGASATRVEKSGYDEINGPDDDISQDDGIDPADIPF